MPANSGAVSLPPIEKPVEHRPLPSLPAAAKKGFTGNSAMRPLSCNSPVGLTLPLAASTPFFPAKALKWSITKPCSLITPSRLMRLICRLRHCKFKVSAAACSCSLSSNTLASTATLALICTSSLGLSGVTWVTFFTSTSAVKTFSSML